MKKKSEISVMQAVRMAYNDEQDLFYAPTFCQRVQAYTKRPYLMDGTILRRLRELRADGEINYRVVDSETSRYAKIVVQ